jgi:hypothetical protein
MELSSKYPICLSARISQDPEYGFCIKRGYKAFDKLVIDSSLGGNQVCRLRRLKCSKSLNINFADLRTPNLLLDRLKLITKTVKSFNIVGLQRLRRKMAFKRTIGNNIRHLDCQMQEFPVSWILRTYNSLKRIDMFFKPTNPNKYHSLLLRIVNFLNLNKKKDPVYLNMKGLSYDKKFMDKINDKRLFSNQKCKFLWDLSHWPPKTFQAFPRHELLDFYCTYAAVSPEFAKPPLVLYMKNIRNLTIERSGLVDPSQELKYFFSMQNFTNIIKFTMSLTGSTAKDIFSMLRFPKSIEYLEMNIYETSRIDYKLEYDAEDLRDSNEAKMKACEIMENKEHFVHLMQEVHSLPNLKELTMRIDCFLDHHVCYILFYYALTKKLRPLRLIHLDLTYKDLQANSNPCDFNVTVFLHLFPNLEELRTLCLKIPNMSFQGINNRPPLPLLEHINIRSNMSTNRESVSASQQFFRDLAYSKIRYLHGYPLVNENFLDLISRPDTFLILKKLTFYPIANYSINPDSIENLIKGLQSKKFLRILILSASGTTLTDRDEYHFNDLLGRLSHLRSVHMSLGDKNLIKN